MLEKDLRLVLDRCISEVAENNQEFIKSEISEMVQSKNTLEEILMKNARMTVQLSATVTVKTLIELGLLKLDSLVE